MNSLKTQNLTQLVNKFVVNAGPENNDPSAPATVGDLNKLVGQIAQTLEDFITEFSQN